MPKYLLKTNKEVGLYICSCDLQTEQVFKQSVK